MKNNFKIQQLVLFIIGILGILDTIIVRAYVQGMDLGVFLPAIIGVACIILSLKPLYEKYLNRINPILKRIIYWAFLVFLFAFILLESCIIIGGIYQQNTEEQPEYLVVLGCGIKPNGSPTLALKNRLDLSMEYAKEHPDTYIVVSGGQGPNEPMPEAHAMAYYLIDRGIKPERIILEDRSSSTMENFQYTKQILGDTDEIAFITNRFHVFRSKILAKRNGFTAYGYGAPTPGIVLINSYLREFFAIVKSLVFDHPYDI